MIDTFHEIGSNSNVRWLLFFGLAALPGCGNRIEAPPTVPVTGSVTFKGQPLNGAQVTFINSNTDSGKAANGTTDGAGNFKLQTYLGGTTQAKGAMPGEYTVLIQKFEAQAAGGSLLDTKQTITGDPTASGAAPGAGQPKLLTPEKYADPTQAEKVTVKAEGGNVFKFELVE